MLTIQQIQPIQAIIMIGSERCVEGSRSDMVQIGIGMSIQGQIQSTIIMIQFDPNIDGFQFIGQNGKIGIDGMSLWQIWQVNMQMPIIILSIPTYSSNNYKIFVILCFLLNFWSIAVFIVLDLLWFYISFEGVLIPMYFQIQTFGSRNRTKAIHASYMQLLYTLFGSQFLFIAQQGQYQVSGSMNYQIITTIPIKLSYQIPLWIAFFICFAIKLPQVPFHIWLLSAHVESPTAGSVIQAAILQKLGSYGQVRYSQTIQNEASNLFRPFIYTIAIISILYTSISALSQIDLKLIIAYSSVGHVGTTLLGLFSNDLLGIQAGIYFMISHGLISSALFLLIGVIYDRYHTRTQLYYRGLALLYPIYVSFLLFFSMANSGFPLTSGFIGEFLSLLGIFISNPFIGFIASLSIVLVPAFMLSMLHRISYGAFSKYLPIVTNDLTIKEFHIFFPLAFFTIFLGIFPDIMLDSLYFASAHCLILYNLRAVYQNQLVAHLLPYSILVAVAYSYYIFNQHIMVCLSLYPRCKPRPASSLSILFLQTFIGTPSRLQIGGQRLNIMRSMTLVAVNTATQLCLMLQMPYAYLQAYLLVIRLGLLAYLIIMHIHTIIGCGSPFIIWVFIFLALLFLCLFQLCILLISLFPLLLILQILINCLDMNVALNPLEMLE